MTSADSRYGGEHAEPDWSTRQNPVESGGGGGGGFSRPYRRPQQPVEGEIDRDRRGGGGSFGGPEPDWGRRQGPMEGPPVERPPGPRYSEERQHRPLPPDDRQPYPDNPPSEYQPRRRFEPEAEGRPPVQSRGGGYRGLFCTGSGNNSFYELIYALGGSRYGGRDNEPDWRQNPTEGGGGGGYGQSFRRGPPPDDADRPRGGGYGGEPDWNRRQGPMEAPPPDRAPPQRYDNREQYPPEEDGWERVPPKRR